MEADGRGGSAALRISAGRGGKKARLRQQTREMLCVVEARRAPGASQTSTHRSCALLGESRALLATRRRRGPQIPGLLLAQRRGSRSSRAGRGRPAPSSRVQDKVCLVWASCDEAGSLASLLVLPGSRPWVAKAAPPPSRPLPFTVFWWLLLSATRLLWQLGGTVRA